MKAKLRCPKCHKKIYYIIEEEDRLLIKCNNCDFEMFKVGKEKKIEVTT